MPEPRRATVAFGRIDTDPSPPANDADRQPVTAGPFCDIPLSGAPADDQTEFDLPQFSNAGGVGPTPEPRRATVAFRQNDPDRTGHLDIYPGTYGAFTEFLPPADALSDVDGPGYTTADAEDDAARMSGPTSGARPIGLGVTASIHAPGHPAYTGNMDPVGDRSTLVTGFAFAPGTTALHPETSADPPSPSAPPGPSSPPPPSTFDNLYNHLFEACNSGYPSAAPVRQCVMIVSESSPTAKGASTAWVQVHAGRPLFGKLSPTDRTLAGLGLHSGDRRLAVTPDSTTHPLFSRCDVTAEYAARSAG